MKFQRVKRSPSHDYGKGLYRQFVLRIDQDWFVAHAFQLEGGMMVMTLSQLHVMGMGSPRSTAISATNVNRSGFTS